MATKRTLAALDAFFEPGQAPRSITPDRVQDLIETLRGGWGRINLTAQVITDITTVGEWVKISGTTALSGDAWAFDMPVNDRLRYTGIVPSRVEVTAAINLTDGNNKTFEVALAKNGVVLADTARTVKIETGGDIDGAVVIGDFQAVTNDYVEIFVRNLTDSTDVTITKMYMRARSYVL